MLDIQKYESNQDVSLEFIDYARTLIGNMKVYEENDLIHMEGIPGRDYVNDIFKVWRTSKIKDNLFTRVKGNSLIFHRFFAPEVLYTLQTTLDARRMEVNKRTIQKAIEELQENTWLSNTLIDHPDIVDYKRLDDLVVTMLPHQREFIDIYNRNVPRYNLNGFLLAAPPGAGKTINGLALAHCLHADTVIVISPNNALYKVWNKTIKTESVFKVPKDCWISQDKKPFIKDCSHFVFHYEALAEALTLPDHHDLGHVVIILDECHNFNEITSQRTQMFVELCKKTHCKHVIWASGTPIKAIGNEAIPLLRTIDPYFTPAVEESFKSIFGKSAQKGLDILQNRMGLITYKVSKDVVRDKQQKPIVIPVKVKLDPKVAERFTLEYIKQEMVEFIVERTKYYQQNMHWYQEEYKRCLKIHQETLDEPEDKKKFKQYLEYIDEISRNYDPVKHKAIALFCNKYEDENIIPTLSNADKHVFRDCKSVVKYVHLKIQGECLGRILGKRRAECNTELVKHAGLEKIIDESMKKTVIFSSWVDTIKEAEDYLLDLKFKPLMVYGGTNKEITPIITKFENDPDANPIIATFQSLSTAVPLIVANTVILLNQPFRDHEWDQAVSRCDRIGQDTQVYVYEVLLDTGNEPNISTRSKDILEWSKQQVAMIMGTDVPNDYNEMQLKGFIDNDFSLFGFADKAIANLTGKLNASLGKLSKYL